MILKKNINRIQNLQKDLGLEFADFKCLEGIDEEISINWKKILNIKISIQSIDSYSYYLIEFHMEYLFTLDTIIIDK